MKKMISKNHVVNLIVGIVFIAFFLVSFFMNMLEDWVTYIAAGLIMIYSVLRFVKDYKHYHDNRVLFILTIEFVVAIGLAVFLLLDFGTDITLTVALGLLLYMRGLAFLLILHILNNQTDLAKFVIYILVLTIGAYILFAGMPFLNHLDVVFLVIGLAIGLFYIFIGINQATHKKPAKTKSSTQ